MVYALIDQLLAHPFSDLHLRSGERPMVRIHGELQAIEDVAPSTPEDINAFREDLLTPVEQQHYTQNGDADFAIQRGAVRLRLNFFKSLRGPGCAIRRLAGRVPDMAALGIPRAAQEAVLNHANGLIVVTGPTGSGKSTTLAAMIKALHQARSPHTITLEDPIEYVHENTQGLVTQRQVGRDTRSFASGLRSALREDPDVIMVGELRDAETIGLALTAAETGHLVLSTLHTRNAQGSITRIIDSLPMEQQSHARVQLADALRLTLSQELWPRRDRSGRVAAYEVMLCTPAVQHLIRDQKTFQIDNTIQTARHEGMQTMKAARQALKDQGLV